ncbi:uncharacterized protein LOC118183299 isoform X2 [Stegodyphus dumicola]|uniref:uncharacterized protein LOC118183299 isoform X2 n=1 Tax=Stegodyphus dumicola TaxID=202533 RepID=UPI0015AD94F2|nr:uncharacterized protein LOC118183299 isoform X2 [Stegodyphus dumicola]
MIYKIFRDGGFICMILFIFMVTIHCFSTYEDELTIEELCAGTRVVQRISPNEKYELKLRSATSNAAAHTHIQRKIYQTSKRKCLKRLETTDSASHFVLVISNFSISSCSKKCQCNYFEVTESGYSRKYCGESTSDEYFESKSNVLSLEFLKGLSMRFEVTLSFTVERNSYIRTGSSINHHFQYIETPYFPNAYQNNYAAEYLLQADDLNDHVVLLFLDFQIAPGSFVEIVGHNGTRPFRFYGDIFRPPFIVSETHRLNLRFEANNQLARLGFRALYSFVKGKISEVEKPFTACGGFENGYGGSLFIPVQQDYQLYDCIWHVIYPFLPHTTSHFLSVLLLSLENIGHTVVMEFRDGLNSKANLLRKIHCQNAVCDNISEIITSASSGLYIRFRGYLNFQSVVRMSYSSYLQGNCSDKEIPCMGNRCLISDLYCDGIQNCPDGSDEENCLGLGTPPVVSPRPSSSPRRLYSSNTAHTFAVLLFIGIIGLIFAVLVVFLIFYRHYKMKLISADTPRPPPSIHSQGTDITPGLYSLDALNCDHPPSYEDYIKASENYPPLLYSRAKQHFRNCTTTFSNSSLKDYAISFAITEDLKSCDNILPDKCLFCYGFSEIEIASTSLNGRNIYGDNLPYLLEPSCSFNRRSVKCAANNFTPMKLSSKRAKSLDSNLNEIEHQNACHLYLPVFHPTCPHIPNHLSHTRIWSLPRHLRINTSYSKDTDIKFESCVKNTIHLSKDVEYFDGKHRRFTWSVASDRASINSDIWALVKARCTSDPNHRVSCSIQFTNK